MYAVHAVKSGGFAANLCKDSTTNSVFNFQGGLAYNAAINTRLGANHSSNASLSPLLAAQESGTEYSIRPQSVRAHSREVSIAVDGAARNVRESGRLQKGNPMFGDPSTRVAVNLDGKVHVSSNDKMGAGYFQTFCQRSADLLVGPRSPALSAGSPCGGMPIPWECTASCPRAPAHAAFFPEATNESRAVYRRRTSTLISHLDGLLQNPVLFARRGRCVNGRILKGKSRLPREAFKPRPRNIVLKNTVDLIWKLQCDEQVPAACNAMHFLCVCVHASSDFVLCACVKSASVRACALARS